MYLTGDESLTSQDCIDHHVRNQGAHGAFNPRSPVGWTVSTPTGRLVPRPTCPRRLRSAHHSQPMASRLSAGLCASHGLVCAGLLATNAGWIGCKEVSRSSHGIVRICDLRRCWARGTTRDMLVVSRMPQETLVVCAAALPANPTGSASQISIAVVTAFVVQ